MLQYQTIGAETLELLKKLQRLDILKETLLAGGTGLALQLGHRKSIDIGLFGKVAASSIDLDAELNEMADVKKLKESKNIHIYLLDNIKVDIVNYQYPWIGPSVVKDTIRIASFQDIAVMKIAAITGRGSRKDFIDLYFLLQQYTLHEIISFYMEKYNDGSEFLAIKSIVYFEDAESDPMPEMLIPVSWKEVKTSIVSSHKKY